MTITIQHGTSRDDGAGAPGATVRPTARDRAGRVLMALNAVAALLAFASGLAITAGVSDDRLISELWRTLAYVVFAGIWTVLAIAPRSHPGLWELVIFHKAAVTAYCFVMWRLADAPETAVVDLVVTLTTLAAYVLCRGWRAWPVRARASRRS